MGQHLVLRHALTSEIHGSEINLASGVALVGGEALKKVAPHKPKDDKTKPPKTRKQKPD